MFIRNVKSLRMNENFTEKSICRERDELNSVIVPEILRRSGDL